MIPQPRRLDDRISYMEIKYFSNKTIVIKSKKEAVLIDPQKKDLDNPKMNSRIVVYTSTNFDYWEPENGERVVIRGPGEYEVGGVEIEGYKGGGEGNSIYSVLVDGVMVGVLGDIKEMLTDKKIERVNAIDVMIVSIGGDNKITFKSMVDLAKRWGVNYLVPINYTDEDLKHFLDETDNEGKESVESLKVDKDNLPDGLEIVVLKDGRNN